MTYNSFVKLIHPTHGGIFNSRPQLRVSMRPGTSFEWQTGGVDGERQEVGRWPGWWAGWHESSIMRAAELQNCASRIIARELALSSIVNMREDEEMWVPVISVTWQSTTRWGWHGRLAEDCCEWHRDVPKVVELYLIWRAEKWCFAKIWYMGTLIMLWRVSPTKRLTPGMGICCVYPCTMVDWGSKK